MEESEKRETEAGPREAFRARIAAQKVERLRKALRERSFIRLDLANADDLSVGLEELLALGLKEVLESREPVSTHQTGFIPELLDFENINQVLKARREAISGTPRVNLPTTQRKHEPSPEVELLLKALRIAGSPQRLAEWMQTPIPALNGQTPYTLLESEEGRKQINAVLGRIDHGVY